MKRQDQKTPNAAPSGRLPPGTAKWPLYIAGGVFVLWLVILLVLATGYTDIPPVPAWVVEDSEVIVAGIIEKDGTVRVADILKGTLPTRSARIRPEQVPGILKEKYLIFARIDPAHPELLQPIDSRFGLVPQTTQTVALLDRWLKVEWGKNE